MRRSFSSTWNARWSETGAAILYFVIRPQQTLGQLLRITHAKWTCTLLSCLLSRLLAAS